MCQRVRIPDEHEDVARPRVHLVERQLRGGQDVEDFPLLDRQQGPGVARAAGEEHQQSAHERECRERSRVASDDHRDRSSANEQAGAEEAEGDFSRANMDVQRRLERLRGRPRSAETNQRRDLQAERRHDCHRVGMREPLHAAAADEHHEHRRGHRDVDGPGWRPKPRVQERQALGNGALDR